ncbi:hypothetical protein PENTCL1PPCAC_19670, partial [Pristionchus entomophagus]
RFSLPLLSLLLTILFILREGITVHIFYLLPLLANLSLLLLPSLPLLLFIFLRPWSDHASRACSACAAWKEVAFEGDSGFLGLLQTITMIVPCEQLTYAHIFVCPENKIMKSPD